MSQLLENVLPPIQSAGLNTNKNATLGGTLSVTGAVTVSAISATGVANFSNGTLQVGSVAPGALSGNSIAIAVTSGTGATYYIAAYPIKS